MTIFRLFLILSFIGISFAIFNSAKAANATPRGYTQNIVKNRGYTQNIVKNLGNNSEFTQKSASKKARNFIEKNHRKNNRKHARKDRRRIKNQKSSANTGVNE